MLATLFLSILTWVLCFDCLWVSAEPSASPAKDNYRMNRYKNKALNPEEMRRRREEEGIQLRKQKREQQVYRPCLYISYHSTFDSFFRCIFSEL